MKYIITYLSLFIVFTLSAQEYAIVGKTTIVHKGTSFINLRFDVTNTGSSDLNLKVELVEAIQSSGVRIDMCFNNTCVLGTPENGNLRPIPSSETGFLRMHVNPEDTNSWAIVKYFLYEDGFYESGDTLTFLINDSTSSTKGISIPDYSNEDDNAINELAHLDGITIFPNPCSGYLNLSMAFFVKDAILELYNQVGERVLLKELNVQKTQLNLSHFSPGVYFTKITSENKRTVKRIIIH